MPQTHLHFPESINHREVKTTKSKRLLLYLNCALKYHFIEKILCAWVSDPWPDSIKSGSSVLICLEHLLYFFSTLNCKHNHTFILIHPVRSMVCVEIRWLYRHVCMAIYVQICFAYSYSYAYKLLVFQGSWYQHIKNKGSKEYVSSNSIFICHAITP